MYYNVVLYLYYLYLYLDQLCLTDNWDDFPNQSMGVTEIEGVNERDELEITDVIRVFLCSLLQLQITITFCVELYGRIGF